MQVWINLGPLLYHFAEAYSQEEVSCLIRYVWLTTVSAVISEKNKS